jgi:hypothetical protein
MRESKQGRHLGFVTSCAVLLSRIRYVPRVVGGAFLGRTPASRPGRTPSWHRALSAAHHPPTNCPAQAVRPHAAVAWPGPARNGYMSAPLLASNPLSGGGDEREGDHDCLLLPVAWRGPCGAGRAHVLALNSTLHLCCASPTALKEKFLAFFSALPATLCVGARPPRLAPARPRSVGCTRRRSCSALSQHLSRPVVPWPVVCSAACGCVSCGRTVL